MNKRWRAAPAACMTRFPNTSIGLTEYVGGRSYGSTAFKYFEDGRKGERNNKQTYDNQLYTSRKLPRGAEGTRKRNETRNKGAHHRFDAMC